MNPFEKDWGANIPVENVPSVPVAYADITVVIDRSASMVSMQDAVVDGFNEQVRKMRETPGDSRWSLVYFDDHDSARGAGEPCPQTVFSQVSEREVPYLALAPQAQRSGSEGYRRAAAWEQHPTPNEPAPPPEGAPTCTYLPRGGTALVDAVCHSIEKAEARTSGREDHTKVVMMVITDGEENASCFRSSQELREMVGRTTGKGWQYLYLGANQDAWAEAGKYNMSQLVNYGGHIASGAVASGAQSSFTYEPTSAGMRQAIASGMTGVAHTVSGSIGSGQLFKPDHVVQGGV